MSLRGKALMVILTTLIGFVGLLFFLSQSILFDSYAIAETDAMTRNIKRVDNELEKQFNALDLIVVDYANWDESYRFLNGENSAYPIEVWTAAIQLNLDVDFLIYANMERDVVFSQAIDRVQQDLRTPTLGELSIMEQVMLFRQVDYNTPIHGLMMINGKPALVTSKPVLTNLAEPPPAGYLIFAKYLSDDLVSEMSKNLELELKIFQVDALLPVYVSEAVNSLSFENTPYIKFLNDTSMQGYGLISDLTQTPILVTQVTETRIISQQGRSTVELFLVLVSLAGLLILGLLSLWIERTILSPLANLSHQLTQITGESKGGKLHINTQDEFGELAKAINAMLERIEESRHIANQTQNIADKTTQKLERVQDLLIITLDQIDEVMGGKADIAELNTYVSYAKRQLKALEKTL